MFRKTASILFLTLFILTQYGRQFSYLQCKVETITGKTTAPTCDCEKDYSKDLDTSDKLPPQKSHTHASPDEYYVLNEARDQSPVEIQFIKPLTYSILSLSSFNGNIFHPPQQS